MTNIGYCKQLLRDYDSNLGKLVIHFDSFILRARKIKYRRIQFIF